MLKSVSITLSGGSSGVTSLNGETGVLSITSTGGTIAVTTPTSSTVNLEASGSAPSFNLITSGTNTIAAMVVGTGASLATSGSGTITATAVPASGLTGTTLAASVVTSSLTAVGTISTGTWQGTAVDAAHGGTGQTSLTAHAVLLGEGTSNVGFATVGTSGRLLIDQGAAADPTFNAMSGDVAITNAGATTIQANAVTTTKINNAAVTYAKIQNASASTLLGNPTGSGAAPSEITLGSGLSFSGTTLVASGGSGTVTTTGSPASGNLTKFSGASSITNGDLAGDVTTSGTLTTTVAKIAGTTVSGTTGTTNVVFSASPTVTGTLTAAAITATSEVITSASANALSVGANGTTNPVFNVDDSTASVVSGVTVKGGATGTGVSLTSISSDTNGAGLNLSVIAKTATANGIGGAISVTAGAGSGSGTGTGGAINITGGTGSVNSPGGAVTVAGGPGGNSATPGLVTISGGTATASAGGSIAITASNGAAANAGGAITITSGQGGTTSTGGTLTITAGQGGISSGTPGNVVIKGGPSGSSSSATAGNVSITGGVPNAGAGGSVTIAGAAGVGTNQNGGNVTLTPGAATGAGTAGNIIVSTFSSAGVVHNDSSGNLTSSTIATGDIAAGAITYAKMQNETASTLLGNPTGGSAAPSEITLGTNLSFSGSILNATGSGTTNYFGSLVYTNTSVPAGNTLTSTSETAFNSSYTIPAGSLNAGDVVRIKLFGVYSGTVLPTIRGKIKFGSTTMVDTTALSGLVTGTNLGWYADALFVVQTNGASGTIESQGYAEFATAATTGLSVNTPNAAPITVDTTASQAVTVTIQWGAGGTGQTITLREMTVEVMRNNSGAANTVQNGGTALTTLTAHAVMLGEGTAAVGFATVGTSGRLLIDQGASADPSFNVVSGDATITNTGALTIANNAVSNAKFRQSAALTVVGNPTTSTANAQDISMGYGPYMSGTTINTYCATFTSLYGAL